MRIKAQDNQSKQKYTKFKVGKFLTQCTFYTLLVLPGGIGLLGYQKGASNLINQTNKQVSQAPASLASPLKMADSEVSYSGATANSAFVAVEPYVMNLQGASVKIPLWGAPRKFDFSGNVPFVDPATGKANSQDIEASDNIKIIGDDVTNAGVPGRVTKQTLNGNPVTMIRYNAGDDITNDKCRSQLNSYPIPVRTHVRWDFEVAFGNADGVNDWKLTKPWESPVLFWQMHSLNQNFPPLAANVDTDANDPTKLMITFFQTVGSQAAPAEIGRVNGILRNTMVPIVIEAFLDERSTAEGGKGLLQISVNNQRVLEKAGPTLALGKNPPWWAMDMYLWNESEPYPYTRASFWKTARMTVLPVPKATSTPSSTVVAAAPAVTQANVTVSAVRPVTPPPVVLPTPVSITSTYVTDVLSTGVTLNWTTNIPSTGVVYSGLSVDNLGSQISDSNLSTKHSVKISGLKRRTTYFYKVSAKNGSTSALSVSSFNTWRRSQ
ncbi:MAG: fibronectin type III domain-containing protein [Methylococcales bacterium]